MDKNVKKALLGVCLLWLIFIAYMMANSPVRAYPPTYTEYEFPVTAGGLDVQYNVYDDAYYDNMTQLFVVTEGYHARVLMRFNNVNVSKYQNIVEWGVKYYVPAAYAEEADDGNAVAVTYDLYTAGTAPTINAAYMDSYAYENGAINRDSSRFTRPTAGNNTLLIGSSAYAANFWPTNLTAAGLCTIDVVFESPIAGDIIAFDSYESGHIPVLYIKVEDYEPQRQVIEEIRGHTIVKKTNDMVYYGLVNPNYWVNLPVLIQVPTNEAEVVNASTYNSTWIQPDLPYGEPWGNETYEGNFYDELILTQQSSYQTQISRCESTDSGKIKIGIFGFERTWGTQTASNVPILYIGGFSKVYSGTFSNRVTNGAFYVGTEIRSYDATTIEVNADSTTASAEARGADLYLTEGNIYLMRYWVGFMPSNYGGSLYNYHYRNNFYHYNQTTGSIAYTGHVEYHFNASDYGDINRVELMETYGGGAFDAHIEAYVTRGFVPETYVGDTYEVYDEDGNLVATFNTLEEAENYCFALEPEWSENSWDYLCFISMLAVFFIPVKIVDELKNLNLSGVFMWLVVECFFAALFMSWILTVA